MIYVWSPRPTTPAIAESPEKQLNYHNPDVVAYVEAVRQRYVFARSGREATKEVHPMKLRWVIPIAVLIPLRLTATDAPVGARVATITINPREVTVLHCGRSLNRRFACPKRSLPSFWAVLVNSRPSTPRASRNMSTSSPLQKTLRSRTPDRTKSGQHVTLELVSDGAGVGTKLSRLTP